MLAPLVWEIVEKLPIDASLIELTGQAGPLNPSRILSQVEGQGQWR